MVSLLRSAVLTCARTLKAMHALMLSAVRPRIWVYGSECGRYSLALLPTAVTSLALALEAENQQAFGGVLLTPALSRRCTRRMARRTDRCCPQQSPRPDRRGPLL